jgi:hypothetical protein
MSAFPSGAASTAGPSSSIRGLSAGARASSAGSTPYQHTEIRHYFQDVNAENHASCPPRSSMDLRAFASASRAGFRPCAAWGRRPATDWKKRTAGPAGTCLFGCRRRCRCPNGGFVPPRPLRDADIPSVRDDRAVRPPLRPVPGSRDDPLDVQTCPPADPQPRRRSVSRPPPCPVPAPCRGHGRLSRRTRVGPHAPIPGAGPRRVPMGSRCVPWPHLDAACPTMRRRRGGCGRCPGREACPRPGVLPGPRNSEEGDSRSRSGTGSRKIPRGRPCFGAMAFSILMRPGV